MDKPSEAKSTTNTQNTTNNLNHETTTNKNEITTQKVSNQENKNTELRTEALVEPKIHTIKIEAETDWPTVIATTLVGIAGILTTLLVGRFANTAQKNQVKSNVATFRHAWQTQLREKMSDFLAKIALIHYKSQRTKEYFKSQDSDTEYSDLLKIQATIMLMLDPKKDYSRETNDLMDECIKALKAGASEKLNQDINKLTKKANQVLESAWSDIKNDLGVTL